MRSIEQIRNSLAVVHGFKNFEDACNYKGAADFQRKIEAEANEIHRRQFISSRQHSEELGEIVHSKVIEALKKASSRLYSLLNGEPHECYIMVPSILISNWIDYLQSISCVSYINKVSFTFRGINIIPAFRNEVVLFHPKNVEVGDDSLLVVVSLSTSNNT